MKKGITLVSIVIYLVLFTTFVAFAIGMNSNMKKNILLDKGTVIVENDYAKIYANLFSSAKNSQTYMIRNNVIEFSNGDVYKFDSIKGLVYKNDGILSDTLKKNSEESSFSIIDAVDLDNINISKEVLNTSKSLCLKVELEKYEAILERQIVVTMGDM